MVLNRGFGSGLARRKPTFSLRVDNQWRLVAQALFAQYCENAVEKKSLPYSWNPIP